MRVCIFILNLESRIGGGEFVTSRVITESPSITFFTFSEEDNASTISPNHQIIRYKSVSMDPIENFLHSAKDNHFEILEVPDWYSFNENFYRLLKKYNVRYKKLVISCHGSISLTLKYNKRNLTDLDLENINHIKESEDFVKSQADSCYGISETYVKKHYSDLDTRLLNPVSLYRHEDFQQTNRVNFSLASSAPLIPLMGRYEIRKGFDALIDIFTRVDKDLYHSFILGKSQIELISMLKDRSLPFSEGLPNNYSEFFRTNTQNKLLIFPSLYDSFNLTALESILHGNKILISKKTGLFDLLNEHEIFKDFFIPIDMSNHQEVSQVINSVLHDNSSFVRDSAHLFTLKLDNYIDINEFSSFYLEVLDKSAGDYSPEYEISSGNSQSEYFHSLRLLYRLFRSTKLSLSFIKNSTTRCIKDSIIDTKLYRVRTLIGRSLYEWRNYSNYLMDLKAIKSFNNKFLKLAEDSITLHKPGVNMYLMMASEISKNLSILQKSVAYNLRVLRNSNSSIDTEVLKKNLLLLGFNNESQAVDFFNKDSTALNDCYDYLNTRFLELKTTPNYDEIECLFDNRDNYNRPKISIIVSLFKATPQLSFFLNNILNLDDIDTGKIEIIFMESASEYNDFDEFLKISNNCKIPMCYFRSSKRETIQKAWNRGILIARGEYLSFLGTDEYLSTNALVLLSNFLDNNLNVDWVIGNSLVKEVNNKGNLTKDVMLYDRHGLTKEHVLLETCYLSWVGALYRKSIHEKYGYYDDSFGAAGDTEFKNRILPFIEIAHINETLGYFANFPSVRQTQSPLAEIEDLRAWYLFRTAGGVKYFIENSQKVKPDFLNFLKLSIRYRKSYCKHWSSDFDLSKNLVEYLNGSSVEINNLNVSNSIRQYQFTNNDFQDGLDKPWTFAFIIFKLARLRNKINSKLQINDYEKISLSNYSELLFSDNRFEQHWERW